MPVPGPADQERLLASLPNDIQALAARGVVRTFRKHAVILHEGEMGDTTYVLLRGRVKVYSTGLDGREITYGIVEPGDYFGEMWLDGGPRSASVEALDPCICSLVSRDALREHLASDPDFALALVTRVIRRVRQATRQTRDLALKDVYGRIAAVLEGGRGAPSSVADPVVLDQLTHQVLANRVGASREMVSRVLKDLERGGYVALGVRRITLLRKLPARW